MAKRKSTKRKKTSHSISNVLLNSKTFPLLLSFSIIGIMFVLIRMKGVEQDYAFNDVSKKLRIQRIENKELKASKAKLLSVKRLNQIAQKYSLKQPDDKHIILVP